MYTISKNVHNYVHSTYIIFQRMNSIVYIQCILFSNNVCISTFNIHIFQIIHTIQ